MITPINIISFTGIKKQNKTQKQADYNNNPKFEQAKNNFIKLSDLSFTGYLGAKRKITFEEGLASNFFKLPKVELEDGTIKQIKPDKSQLKCAQLLCEGKTVLFDAPTGMGKTSVAHFAISKNLEEGKRTIYTVPIKALANDKYDEFCKIYGKNKVGVLTGDRKINPHADVVIMTAEIYDNQAQNQHINDALKIGTVVYDEAHYIGDSERGFAWEHSMINTSLNGIQMLLLSATIGNADEIAEWLNTLPNKHEVERVSVPQSQRPVPLVWNLFARDKQGGKLIKFVEGEVDLVGNLENRTPEIQEVILQAERERGETRIRVERKQLGLSDDYLKVQEELNKRFDYSYQQQIPKRFAKVFGEDWIYVDYKDKANYEKLRKLFPSLDRTDLDRVIELINQSGINSLTDRQKMGLEALFRAEYPVEADHEMTREDYEFIYFQLKGAIAQDGKEPKFTTTQFKKLLRKEFENLTDIQCEQIAQLISNSDEKTVKAIHQNWHEDNYTSLVETLKKDDKLPAIIFKLSQEGCDDVVRELFGEDPKNKTRIKTDKEGNIINPPKKQVDLLTPEEKEEARKIINKYKKNGVYLGVSPREDMLLKGYAVHHGGKIPQYKKLVEELFAKKLIKVVIATSTLGAGINMPARTVVMSNSAYSQYNPKLGAFTLIPLSSNEFHQMTGRAGRRGIDEVGNIVLYNQHTAKDRFNTKDYDPDSKKAQKTKLDELWHSYQLIDSGADDLRSSFKPQPVMLAKYFSKNQDMQGIYDLINRSFKHHISKNKASTEESMFERFEKYTNVLIKQGYLYRNHKKEHTLTPKGMLLAQAQGLNPMMLTGLLYDEKLKGLSPAQLAQLMAHIQGSFPYEEFAENDRATLAKISILQKETAGTIALPEYEKAKSTYEDLQSKINRHFLEIANYDDVKYTDCFSGLVGYMFAKLNEQNPADSTKNFEAILKTTHIQTSEKEVVNRAYDKKANEGNVYKIISGSISGLKQIVNVCNYALKHPELYPNDDYYKEVIANATAAIELLDKEPINNDPDYAYQPVNI